MNTQRLQSALALSSILASALALSACSSTTTDPDTGPRRDTGGVDAEAADQGGADTGRPDTGRPDTGVRDAAAPDAMTGPSCDPASPAEGCACNPIPGMQQGDCQTGLLCVTWRAQSATATRLSSCIRRCTADADCMTVGLNLCRAIRAGLACVSEEAADGDICNSSRRDGRTMKGCKTTSACISDVIREPGPMAGTTVVSSDQGSCGQICRPGATANCPAAKPYCNPRVLTSTTNPGICSDTRRAPGALCTQTDITKACDTSTNMPPNVSTQCIGLPAPISSGVCIGFCDPRARPDTCIGRSSTPGRPAHCAQVFRNDPTTGVCTDACGQFPDTCAGQGSGNGMNCHGPYQFEAMPIEGINVCVDVQPPVLREWDFRPPSSMPCNVQPTDPLRCEHGTFCVGLGGTNGSGCIRGCTTSTAARMTGCMSRTATVCDNMGLMGLGRNEGICRP